MTVLAVSTGAAILAWIGLVLGLVVLGVVVSLFNRIVIPAREIEQYAGDILEGGQGIAMNLEGAEQLGTTVSLGGQVPGLAVAYLKKLGLA